MEVNLAPNKIKKILTYRLVEVTKNKIKNKTNFLPTHWLKWQQMGNKHLYFFCLIVVCLWSTLQTAVTAYFSRKQLMCFTLHAKQDLDGMQTHPDQPLLDKESETLHATWVQQYSRKLKGAHYWELKGKYHWELEGAHHWQLDIKNFIFCFPISTGEFILNAASKFVNCKIFLHFFTKNIRAEKSSSLFLW